MFWVGKQNDVLNCYVCIILNSCYICCFSVISLDNLLYHLAFDPSLQQLCYTNDFPY